jgi:hypothetical protein
MTIRTVPRYRIQSINFKSFTVRNGLLVGFTKASPLRFVLYRLSELLPLGLRELYEFRAPLSYVKYLKAKNEAMA